MYMYMYIAQVHVHYINAYSLWYQHWFYVFNVFIKFTELAFDFNFIDFAFYILYMYIMVQLCSTLM